MSTASAAAIAAVTVAAGLPPGVDPLRLVAWMQASDELAAAKAREMKLRQELLAAAFPETEPGTRNIELGASGYTLTSVLRLSYRLDEVKTRAALEKLRATGEVGAHIADRLVRWKPDLSISEHKKLTPKQAALFRTALTITPSQPTLEVKPPKGS